MPAQTSITIKGAEETKASLDRMVSALNRPKQAYARAGRAVRENLKVYHRQFRDSGRWENKGSPTHGPGRKKTRFGTSVADGWSGPVAATDEGVTVTNRSPQSPALKLKIHGGTVRPQSADKLTIPTDPRAHGRSTRQFEAITGLRLFRPRSKDWLAVKENGQLKVIYVLRDSVFHKKVRGALPPGERIAKVFSDSILETLDRASE